MWCQFLGLVWSNFKSQVSKNLSKSTQIHSSEHQFKYSVPPKFHNQLHNQLNNLYDIQLIFQLDFRNFLLTYGVSNNYNVNFSFIIYTNSIAIFITAHSMSMIRKKYILLEVFIELHYTMWLKFNKLMAIIIILHAWQR